MVKGISKQIIVVNAPEPKLFEQAIFILREDVTGEGITDEILLKEAKKAIRESHFSTKANSGLLWACLGAVLMGALWLLTYLL